MGAADVAVGSPPASPTAATQTQRTTRVTKGTAFDGACAAKTSPQLATAAAMAS